MSDELPGLSELRDAAPSDAVRQRIVAGAQVRTQARGRWFPALLAGAAAATAVALWLTLPEPPAAPADQVERAVAQGVPVPARILPEPGAQVDVVKTEDALTEVALRAGKVVFHVDHRPAGSVFRVKTAELVIEVVGTRFSVDRVGQCTAVSVSEGKVRVSGRDERLLAVGESFQECQQGAAQVPAAPPAGVPGEALVHGALDRILAGRDLPAAASQLDAYLTQHPAGVFAQEALFHLALVRQRLGHPQAEAAARRFIERFPSSGRAQRLRQQFPSLED